MAETPEHRAELTMLIDFYSALLNPRQKQIAEMYYGDDMSLSEISEELGITRQGVHDALKKAESKLIDTEAKLGLVSRFDSSKKCFSYIIERLEEISRETGGDFSDIIDAAQQML